MKELQAKAKVTQTMTRDGLVVENQAPGAVRVGYPSDKILSYLKKRIEMDGYPNSWFVQGGGGIETLAAVPLTINEMLLQSYEGIIRVFPNWNRKKDASFENLRAYGAFLVTSTLKEGLIQGVTLVSEKGRVCKIENPWKGRPVQVIRENGKADILYGEYLQIPTVVGEKVELNLYTN